MTESKIQKSDAIFFFAGIIFMIAGTLLFILFGASSSLPNSAVYFTIYQLLGILLFGIGVGFISARIVGILSFIDSKLNQGGEKMPEEETKPEEQKQEGSQESSETQESSESENSSEEKSE